jgi:peptidoglycan-N-acetylglucosamine deacetylase
MNARPRPHGGAAGLGGSRVEGQGAIGQRPAGRWSSRTLDPRPFPFAALILALFTAGCVTATEQPRASAGDRASVGRTIAPNKLDSRQALVELQAERDRFWCNARKAVDKSVLELVAQHQAELQRGLRFCKLMRGDPTRKQIALTFDDGPHPSYTPKLLAILQQYHVKATFFLVGEMAEKYPELARAEATAGHSIGNHTYHHVSLFKISVEDIAVEL